MLSVVFVLLAAISVGTIYFWRYIKAFEDSRLEHTIQFLQDNVDLDFWESQVEDALKMRLTEFERDGPTPMEPYLPKIRDVRYVLRQDGEASTPDAPVYVLRAGARDIGVFRFAQTESLGFGFYLWDVSSVEFLDSFVDSFDSSVSITASQNARVLLNGVAVSLDYLVDCEHEYGASYLIEGMYGEAQVSVYEFDGEKPDPYYAEGGVFLYPITIPPTRRFNIIVPEGAFVLADGEQIPADSITGDRIIPDVFAGVVDPADVPEAFIRYEFELSGLYTEPEIIAVDASGRDLIREFSPDGEVKFTPDFSDDHKELYSGTVEDFFRAYVTFATNIGGRFDSNLASLSNYVLSGSDLLNRLRGTRASMDWVGGNSVTYNMLEIDNFRAYGENYFSCEVDYRITARHNYGSRVEEGSFEILFVHSGKWVAVNMV